MKTTEDIYRFILRAYCVEIKKPEEKLTFEHTEQAMNFAQKVMDFLRKNNFIDSEKQDKREPKPASWMPIPQNHRNLSNVKNVDIKNLLEK